MNITESWNSKLQGGILYLDHWDEFIAFINDNNDSLRNCLFRGQQNPKWDLKPSIFRSTFDSYENLYNQQLKSFKLQTRGKHSIPYDSPYDDDVKWWSLGQHYGLATPLLDWVRSPYVAAFFSYQKKLKKCNNHKRAIFIFDYYSFEKLENIKPSGQSSYIEKADTLTHDNARLVSQQGELIYLSPINQIQFQTIESALDKFKKEKKIQERLLLKIIIPDTEREKILYRLDQMNINNATLFPDLTGAASYCNYLNKID